MVKASPKFPNPLTPEAIVKFFEGVAYDRQPRTLFDDWLGLCVNSIASSLALWNKAELDAKYLDIAGKYDKDQLTKFAELMGALTLALSQPPREDLLGMAYMALECNNKRAGQFFTPMSVCKVMSEMMLADTSVDSNPKRILTMSEPAVGAGACILATVNSLAARNFPYWSHFAVEAIDVDLRCFRMTYLQLALSGIPAIVRHGNTLTQEFWNSFATPAYVFNRVGARLAIQAEKEKE